MIGSEPVAAVGSLKGAYRVRFDAWEASSALSMTAASAPPLNSAPLLPRPANRPARRAFPGPLLAIVRLGNARFGFTRGLRLRLVLLCMIGDLGVVSSPTYRSNLSQFG
jgi:hypothetical protein